MEESKERKSSNSKKILFIIIGLVITGIIAAGIAIFTTKNKDAEEKNSDEENFNIQINAVRYAAEDLFEKNKNKDSRAYTISYLKQNTTKNIYNESDGCIIIQSNENGEIDKEILYLSNGEYMIISGDIKNSLDYSKITKKFSISNGDDSWRTSYTECNFDNDNLYKYLNDEKDDEEFENEQIKTEEISTSKNSNTSNKKTNTQTSSQTATPTVQTENTNTTTTETSGISVSKQNAIKKAKSYLNYMAFSRDGLIHQLEFEKFSNEDAVYAVDNISVDWNAQAVKKAKSYLDSMAFSRQSLIKQLKYEKFTDEQAEYAVNNISVDWNEQAAKKAQSYLNSMAFSRDGLIHQLEYEGFTHDQAVYGVDKVGL